MVRIFKIAYPVFFFLLVSAGIYAQSSVDSQLLTAERESNSGRYTHALALYTAVLKEKPQQSQALVGRGKVRMLLEDYDSALLDFNAALEFIKDDGELFFLRGNAFFETGSRMLACKDWEKACYYSYKKAEEFLNEHCLSDSVKASNAIPMEEFVLDWEEGWELSNSKENEQLKVQEFLKKGESYRSWTEFGSMFRYVDISDKSVNEIMNLFYLDKKNECEEARLTVWDETKSSVIFKVECPKYKNGAVESGMYQIVKGREALFFNFRAVKEPTVNSVLEQKWLQFFKRGKLVKK